MKYIFLTLLFLALIVSCTDNKPQTKTSSSTSQKRIISGEEASLAEILEGRWYNASFFDTLSKTKDFSETMSKVGFTEYLTFEKDKLLSDNPRISWDGYDCGGDYYYTSYNKTKNSLEVRFIDSNGGTEFSIYSYGSKDSLYCIFKKNEKHLFLRENFKDHEEFKYEFNKAMIVGDYFVKSDTSRKVNFSYPNIVNGIGEGYKYYSLNVFSADYQKTATFFKEGDDYTKGEFFRYEIYKDSVVLERVDEYINSLDSTLVLIPTNQAPQ